MLLNPTCEQQRRRKVSRFVDHMRRSLLQQPQVLVVAPVSVVNPDFTDLPGGVRLEPGRITVEFETPTEALEQLLALAMAIGNNRDRFDALTARDCNLNGVNGRSQFTARRRSPA